MATEIDAVPQDIAAEEEPRYLRRQKPVEIRRRKFGKRTWPFYRRALAVSGGLIAASCATYFVASFFLSSPRVTLASLDDVEVLGTKYVPRQTVVDRFSADAGRSIFRVPLDTRRASLESIGWVDHAVVSRIWPNRIRVELTERVPVAYLRSGSELSLIDAHGMILDRPLESNFQFPVISGISDAMSAGQREARMGLYSEMMMDVDRTRPGTADHVSEVDLSDAEDVRVTLAGLNQMSIANFDDDTPVLVHFGNKDFDSKYKILLENLGQWRIAAGRVESVDLRFSRQVVVNPESRLTAAAQRTRGRQ